MSFQTCSNKVLPELEAIVEGEDCLAVNTEARLWYFLNKKCLNENY